MRLHAATCGSCLHSCGEVAVGCANNVKSDSDCMKDGNLHKRNEVSSIHTWYDVCRAGTLHCFGAADCCSHTHATAIIFGGCCSHAGGPLHPPRTSSHSIPGVPCLSLGSIIYSRAGFITESCGTSCWALCSTEIHGDSCRELHSCHCDAGGLWSSHRVVPGGCPLGSCHAGLQT